MDFNVQRLEEGALPVAIAFPGSFEAAYSWVDKNGKNVLVLSSDHTATVPGPENRKAIRRSATLYAKQFVIEEDSTFLLWDIVDFEKDCPYDLTVSFLPDAVRVTDLDQNGISETTIAYQLSCRSDFTSAYMKILLHEGDQKFGLRGQRTWQSGLPANFVYDANVLDEEESAT